jgi:hypothetical protein
MKSLNYERISKHLLFIFLGFYFLMLFFNYFENLPSVFSVKIFFSLFMISFVFYFVQRIKKIPLEERRNSRLIYIFSHLFLLTLIVFALNQFLKRAWVLDNLFYLSIISIAFGILTFYSYAESIGKKIENTNEKEKELGVKRYNEFESKFPKINKMPVLGNFLKWIYKEGWVYSLGLLLIIIIFIFLRIYSLDYIDSSDNYNDIAIKALYQNDNSCYDYSSISTKLMLLSVGVFGFNAMALKLPFIFYSLITIIFIYFIARFLNKPTALLSAFLFAISPWSIILSKVTRDYSFDCMLGSIVLFMSLWIYTKFKEKISLKNKIYNIINLLLVIIFVYLLSLFNRRPHSLIVLIFPTILGVFMVYNFLKDYFKIKFGSIRRLRIFYFSIISLFFIGGTYFINRWPFTKGYSFNIFYFDVFFNPLIASPWHWFHNNLLTSIFIVFLFLVPALFIFNSQRNKSITSALYSIFLFGLFIYLFKYSSHLDYTPTRYIYFLFPVFVIIFSLSIFYIINYYKHLNILNLFVSIIILFLLLFNFTSFYYSIDPIKAYDSEKISNLKVDNLGTGRFEMKGVVDFIKKDLGWNSNDFYVFGGRYGEFILLLDYEIDDSRCLKSSNVVDDYDVGKNMFVESSFFNYHELENALLNEEGYFITEDNIITNSNGEIMLEIKNNDFLFYGKKFIFIKEINNFKIFKWD